MSALVTITRADTAARLSLRVRETGRVALGQALGFALPDRIGDVVDAAACRCLCLGPDEWLIHTARDQVAGVLAQAETAAAPHSLVDISDRETSFVIEGPEAETLLAIGCPTDLREIPLGTGKRTVFDGASAILWHRGEGIWQLDIWQSFAPHVEALLETGRAEIETGL